jgi:hypothetical protein
MRASRGGGELGAAELQQMADYFDRTDAGDLPWEEASDMIVGRPELEQVSLRLPKDDLAALKRRATAAGIGYTTLIRMIVRRYLSDPLSR